MSDSPETPPCSACGQRAPLIWVHGHGQCSHCGTNTAPCCDGVVNTEDRQCGPPRALLFDLDGTLIDSLADIAHAANHVRAIHGLPPLPQERVRSFVGDGPERLLRGCLETGEEHVSIDTEIQAFREYYFEHPIVDTVLYPGIRELIAAAREAGLVCAVVTNKPEGITKRVLELLEIHGDFGIVVGCDTAARRKPAPDPVWAALEALEVARELAWMIGDGPQDIHAGRAAGVVTCAVEWGFGDVDEVRAAQPDRRASSVERLAQILGLNRPLPSRTHTN